MTFTVKGLLKDVSVVADEESSVMEKVHVWC